MYAIKIIIQEKNKTWCFPIRLVYIPVKQIRLNFVDCLIYYSFLTLTVRDKIVLKENPCHKKFKHFPTHRRISRFTEGFCFPFCYITFSSVHNSF